MPISTGRIYKVLSLFIFLTFCHSLYAQDAPKEIIFEVPISLKIADAEASSSQRADTERKETFYPQNAIDGNPKTRWSSDFKEPQWLMVDLGGVFDIDKVVISWESAYAVAYRIELLIEGGDWKEAFSTEMGDGKSDTVAFPLQKARYVKINCLKRKSTLWGFSIFDITVYGKRKLILF